MATQNNLHVPDDLLNAVNEAASAEGKTTEELATDALRRYVAHRKLEELGNYGLGQSLRLGYTEDDVPRLIAEPGVNIVAAKITPRLRVGFSVRRHVLGCLRWSLLART
ncbi:MAG: hypothetical protein ACLQU1_21225 [Bryobacteraceae bacterium]